MSRSSALITPRPSAFSYDSRGGLNSATMQCPPGPLEYTHAEHHSRLLTLPYPPSSLAHPHGPSATPPASSSSPYQSHHVPSQWQQLHAERIPAPGVVVWHPSRATYALYAPHRSRFVCILTLAPPSSSSSVPSPVWIESPNVVDAFAWHPVRPTAATLAISTAAASTASPAQNRLMTATLTAPLDALVSLVPLSSVTLALDEKEDVAAMAISAVGMHIVLSTFGRLFFLDALSCPIILPTLLHPPSPATAPADLGLGLGFEVGTRGTVVAVSSGNCITLVSLCPSSYSSSVSASPYSSTTTGAVIRKVLHVGDGARVTCMALSDCESLLFYATAAAAEGAAGGFWIAEVSSDARPMHVRTDPQQFDFCGIEHARPFASSSSYGCDDVEWVDDAADESGSGENASPDRDVRSRVVVGGQVSSITVSSSRYVPRSSRNRAFERNGRPVAREKKSGGSAGENEESVEDWMEEREEEEQDGDEEKSVGRVLVAFENGRSSYVAVYMLQRVPFVAVRLIGWMHMRTGVARVQFAACAPLAAVVLQDSDVLTVPFGVGRLHLSS
eukprot:ANDGO_06830.mRNA.1 hypothetical protein